MSQKPWAIGALLLLAVLQLGGGLWFRPDYPATFFYDDSYYYFEIAHNVVVGEGMTFDGTAKTNGVQPLWFVVILILTAIFRPEPGLGGALFFGIVCWGGYIFLAYLLWKWLRELFDGWTANIVVLLLAYSRIVSSFTRGMESLLVGILILLFAMQLYRVWLQKEIPVRASFMLGGLAAALALTRLDHALIVMVMLLIFWLAHLKDTSLFRVLRNGVILTAPTFLCHAGYFLFNKLYFGHWMQTSGAIKLASDVQFQFGNWNDQGVQLLVLINFAVLLWSVFRLCRGHNTPFLKIMLAWSAGNAIYLLFLMFEIRWVIPLWYFGSHVLLGIVAAALVIHLFSQYARFHRFQFRVITAVVGLVIVGFSQIQQTSKYTQDDDFQYAVRRAAIWCNTHLPERTAIGMGDAGLFGYYSALRVVNIDGLVNEWAYLEACKIGKGPDYLNRRGITYIATVFGNSIEAQTTDTLRYRLPIPVGKPEENVLTFHNSDIVYKETWANKYDPRGYQTLVIFQWPSRKIQIKTGRS